MDRALDFIKKNKMFLIVLAVIVVGFAGLKMYQKARQVDYPPFVQSLLNLRNEDKYTGNINFVIGDNAATVEVIKNGDMKNIAVQEPLSYPSLLYKEGNTILMDNSVVNDNGGLISITKKEVKDFPDLIKLMILSISSENGVTFKTDGDKNVALVEDTDAWKTFFTALSSVIAENSDAVIAGVNEDAAVKEQLKYFESLCTQWGNTNTVANSIYISIGESEENSVKKYTGSFNLVVNFELLPSYISADDFDSNQLNVSGTYSFSVIESTAKKPSGATYSANPATLSSYAESLWNKLFSKVPYVSMNEVSVSDSVVVNKYNLGLISEIDTYKFDTEGVISAEYKITVTSEAIARSYTRMYEKNLETNQSNLLRIDNDDGSIELVFTASDDALTSINKIGTTPQKLGEYLKSSKGGDIIV